MGTQKKLSSSPIVLEQEEGEGEAADQEDDGGQVGEEEEEEEEEGDGPGESSPLLEQGIIKTVDPLNFPMNLFAKKFSLNIPLYP